LTIPLLSAAPWSQHPRLNNIRISSSSSSPSSSFLSFFTFSLQFFDLAD
ncbi:hypothetical protein TRV_06921, partial [Trichophyton verrucosum HKI 0517]